jgi:hypothetical protein
MKWLVSCAMLLAVCFIYSCKKSDSSTGGNNGGGGGGGGAYTPNCTGAAIQFNANVAPIISSSCAIPTCHASGSSNGPGQLTTYAEISAAKTQIRAAVLSGAMPKSGSLTSAQKNSIICWVDAGGLNN